MPSHGTVNVILANENGLVAVTDSMLTYTPVDHRPVGVKLFKIDDQTICTMAGLYDSPGPGGDASFTADIPQMLSDYVRTGSPGLSHRSFTEKVASLSSMIEFELSASLQALVAADSRYPVENGNLGLLLTVAGYDKDGSLKIADLTFVAERIDKGVRFKSVKRPPSAVMPLCSFATETQIVAPPDGTQHVQPLVRQIGKSFFCEVAGIPEVAEKALNRPSDYRQNVKLMSYAKAKAEGRTLSLREMRELAVESVRLTEVDETTKKRYEVGGPTQIAVLSGGKLIEEPRPNPSQKLGRSLPSVNISGTRTTCPSPGAAAFTVDGMPIQMQIEMTRCTQKIDGIVFHDSIFTDDQMSYLGGQPFIFADTNEVRGSTLHLGPNVDLTSKDVRHLACSFAWKTIMMGDSELKDYCRPRSTRD
jgi:hypothetical protein